MNFSVQVVKLVKARSGAATDRDPQSLADSGSLGLYALNRSKLVIQE